MKPGRKLLFALIITSVIGPVPLQSEDNQDEPPEEKKGITAVFKRIENGVVTGYKTIENGVVFGYKAVERFFVSAYEAIEARFINTALASKKDSSDDEEK